MIIASSLLLVIASCSSKKEAAIATASPSDIVESPVNAQISSNMNSASMQYVPKAVIYRTNGDYNDNVPVNLSSNGKSLVSFPDPKDLTVNSTPVVLDDGWLLDRRGGIGYNTAFLKYTYDEYRALSHVPSIRALLDNVIPEAKVTAVRELPITLSESIADPSLVNQFIK